VGRRLKNLATLAPDRLRRQPASAGSRATDSRLPYRCRGV
jgi:hypothetical protein